MPTMSKAAWLVPAGLILLGLVPIAAGTARLVELAGHPGITPANARFVGDPVPVVLHIVAAAAYAVLGAFQFSGELRRRRPGWHRAAGRVLVPMGLVAALSGLWMTQVYLAPPADRALALYIVRMAVGSAMALFLVLGLVAIRRGEIARHQAWMMRAYGLGLGAGTQVLTHLPWLLTVGLSTSTFTRTALMSAGWLINIVVVESILARRHRRGTPGRGAWMAPTAS